uniref:FeoB-associated Cys-rich membrane protein n=1 Tax=Candidatus Electronema sp. TaxID=2698783 RepID=UPI0040563668
MQTVAVIFIVLLACVFVGRKLFSAFRTGGSSCGGCSGCVSGSCSAPKAKEEEP